MCHKFCDYLFLSLGIGRNILRLERIALEEVRNQHHRVEAHGEKVSTLKGLAGEPKDIIEVDYAHLSVRVSGHISSQTVNYCMRR